MELLNDTDRDFLAWLRQGKTIASYCSSHGYSREWGKWKSRQIRHLLGVETIGEAVVMADDDAGVSKLDFDKLFGAVGKLSDAVDELAKRPTTEKQETVRERELDVKDHAKALGLSLEDVERLKGEKEYTKWLEFETRRQKELDDEEAEEGGGDNGVKPKGTVEKVLDGLGGIKNVKQQ